MSKTQTQIRVKVYLKSIKKPLILIFGTSKQVSEFYAQIETSTSVVKCGGLIFAKDDFRCAMYEIKTVKKFF